MKTRQIPASVFATGAVDASGSINHVVTQYQYPDGPSVCAEGSWLLTSGFNMAYTLFCERATLDYDLARGPDALRVTEAGQATRAVPLDEQDGYGVEVRYMVDCIAQGRPPETVTAQDGLTALEICEAEEQSVRSGALVSL